MFVFGEACGKQRLSPIYRHSEGVAVTEAVENSGHLGLGYKTRVTIHSVLCCAVSPSFS